MSINYLRSSINKILNMYKSNKKYIILQFNVELYTIINLLNTVIKYNIYIIFNYIIIIFKKENKKIYTIKFFDCNIKKNYLSLSKLRKISYLKGIVFTSKGIFSIQQAIKNKVGGILFCLIKF